MTRQSTTQTQQTPTTSPLSQGGILQRQCNSCGQKTVAGSECAECQKKKSLLQRHTSSQGEIDEVPAIVHEVLRSSGQPLDADTRIFMESRFSQDFSEVKTYTSNNNVALAPISISKPDDEHEREANRLAETLTQMPEPTIGGYEPNQGRDFSNIRVHTDTKAAESARAVNALAYTVNHHIVFGTGQYSPHTTGGRQLLAHELTHTLQQNTNDSSVNRMLMRKWDQPGASDCIGEPTNKWIRTVVVEQETPQSVTLNWSDGSINADTCSTGKGQCCIPTSSPEGVACSVRESRNYGTNCTPITEGQGYPIVDRYLNYNGWQYWSTFVRGRGIGLHQHHTVTGAPLSHGCVRLNLDMARKIFCGARQNQTKVQVQGFARPKCDSQQLQSEWLADFSYAARPTDGEPPNVRRGIRETRESLRRAFGVNDAELTQIITTVQANPTQIAQRIPRCSSTGALPTFEEESLTAAYTSRTSQPQIPSVGTVPAQILAVSGFNRFLIPFEIALASARNFKQAYGVVRDKGRELWQTATTSYQRITNPIQDDRAIYWARLQMERALRQWQPSFIITSVQRQQLLLLFEQVSRGMDSATFSKQQDIKKILISGFDPFGLRNPTSQLSSYYDVGRSNPSGAAVLSLDGRSITNGSIVGEVQGVIFPVSFTAFDAGIVENFFRPYLSGSNLVNMIMTISQGGTGFEVEEYAGRRRSTTFGDNLGTLGGGNPTVPFSPTGISSSSPEFLTTTLPTREIRTALGRTAALSGETEVTEIPAGQTTPVTRSTGGPTAGSTAVEGSGGGFLSNEIFYRTLLLRSQEGATIPVGHLHTPDPSLPNSPSSTQIAREIERILIATLPVL